MGGLLRFLLGGVLGAALGIALARRRTPVPRKSGLYPSQRAEVPVPPKVEAPAPAGAESFAPAMAEAAAPPAVFAREEAVTTTPEAVPLEDLEDLVEEVSEVGVSEIVVTPEILEEPVPGTGWSPSAVLEEEAFESVLPVIPEEVMPQSVAEETTEAATWAPAGTTEAATRASAEAPSALAREGEAEVPPAEPVVEIPVAQDLRARIEATRRRIREELERPFITDFEIRPVPPSRPARETQAAPSQATTNAEAAAPRAAGGVRGAESVAPEHSPVEPSPRGEGQRQEARLEGETAERRTVERSTVVPSAGPAAASAAGPTPGASAPTPVVSMPAPAPSAGTEARAPDFEAVRQRIELARNRLKAKAFDAMMAGESALLARDESGARPGPVKLESVDREIDQTIETTLREHED